MIGVNELQRDSSSSFAPTDHSPMNVLGIAEQQDSGSYRYRSKLFVWQYDFLRRCTARSSLSIYFFIYGSVRAMFVLHQLNAFPDTSSLLPSKTHRSFPSKGIFERKRNEATQRTVIPSPPRCSLVPSWMIISTRLLLCIGNTHLSKRTLPQISPALKYFLVEHSTNGTIARQELGSMIPTVLALAGTGCIQGGTRIFDLCASAGNKTLHASHGSCGYSQGRVRANDVNES